MKNMKSQILKAKVKRTIIGDRKMENSISSISFTIFLRMLLLPLQISIQVVFSILTQFDTSVVFFLVFYFHSVSQDSFFQQF